MGQLVLLPVDLDDLIPSNHLVRVVNAFIDQMDMVRLLGRYKGGGTSSYHPKMMMKAIVFAYTQRIYSSRRIAKALRESIPFMWLSGNNQPDFRTINRFRGEILKGIIEEVFTSVLKLLITEGYVKLEEYFVDGTKVEASANRYTAVWAKNTERYEKQLAEKVAELIKEIEQINQVEDARYGDKNLEEVGGDRPIDEQKLADQVKTLNEHLQAKTEEQPAAKPETETNPEAAASSETATKPDAATKTGNTTSLSSKIENKLAEIQPEVVAHPENKSLAKLARELAEDCLVRARKYDEQRQKLAGRNSYSKTDPDATFLRMKEDHLPGSQPKPGYNIQNGTEGQFVVCFSVHQQAGDTTCLIPHLDKLKSWLGKLPQKVDSDAGYGSEENYAYLEREQVGNYLKYSGFDREQKKRYVPNSYHADNMLYDPQKNTFTCPAGKSMRYLRTEHSHTVNGFPTEHGVYSGEDCQNCHLKEKCTKAAGNRQIRVSFRLQEYRQQARNNLLSEEGQRLRKQRGVDVETVFGRIKGNWGFRRFLLRGFEKVTVEWGLLCLAHNLAKVWSCKNEKNLAVV